MARRIAASGVVCGAMLLALIHPAAAVDTAPTVRVPFVSGLTTVRATSEPRGDYETLRVVDTITAAGYRITASGEVPGDDGRGSREVSIVRRVKAGDQRAARTMRNYFHTSDPELFPGTVPGFSAAQARDLRQEGRTSVTYQDVGVLVGRSVIRRELTGMLVRVKSGTTSLPLLVNGRHVRLPVLHAKGRLSDGGTTEEFEFHVLDDPANPIVLGWRGARSSSSLIRIEYPEPEGSSRTIERVLAGQGSAEIHGIYFSFGSAVIRPHSERVLVEIADALREQPQWRLRIDGHTDGIGDEASNLDLSKRRAAAVGAALSARHGIAPSRLVTDGSGESRPNATNDTPEGRAHNRRVELTRL